jgi:hypothetical protein
MTDLSISQTSSKPITLSSLFTSKTVSKRTTITTKRKTTTAEASGSKRRKVNTVNLTGGEKVIITSDSEKSSGEEKNEDNGGFIPIEELEAKQATVSTKAIVQRKRKTITYNSSSEEKDELEDEPKNEPEKTPLTTNRPKRSAFAMRHPRKSFE